jgi:hypothetical protein
LLCGGKGNEKCNAAKVFAYLGAELEIEKKEIL